MSAPTITLSIPNLPDGVDNLTAALAYAAAGIYVVPVLRGTKNPGSILGKRWQTQSSRDPKQITAWFAGTDHDVALHCGRSGSVVLRRRQARQRDRRNGAAPQDGAVPAHPAVGPGPRALRVRHATRPHHRQPGVSVG